MCVIAVKNFHANLDIQAYSSVITSPRLFWFNIKFLFYLKFVLLVAPVAQYSGNGSLYNLQCFGIKNVTLGGDDHQ